MEKLILVWSHNTKQDCVKDLNRSILFLVYSKVRICLLTLLHDFIKGSKVCKVLFLPE